MIDVIASRIMEDYEALESKGEQSLGGYVIAWHGYENTEGRVLLVLFSIHPINDLSTTDITDILSEISSVWGVRTHYLQNGVVLMVETLRVAGDPLTIDHPPDADGDEIIR